VKVAATAKIFSVFVIFNTLEGNKNSALLPLL
jgi:hypothetical protein